MLRYAWHDVIRNPRRTLTALVGILLGVGLFSGVLFFSNGSGATLTRRAVAPLALDMQAVLGSPLGRPLTFTERIAAPGRLQTGQRLQIVLRVRNGGSTPANDVVINDDPPPPLRYVPGSMRRNGRPIPDVGGHSPLFQGPVGTGLNIGVLHPGASVTFEYQAQVGSEVPAATALRPRGRISSRENVVPQPANAPPPVTPAALAAQIRRIPGVIAAHQLTYVDLPAGSVRAGAATVANPVRLFAFDPAYQRRHPSIRIVDGALRPGSAMLSAEAARALGVGTGGRLSLTVPGSRSPVAVAVSGTADLAQARPLFSSRKISKFEDFLYVPNSVIVDTGTFQRSIRPAFAALAATAGTGRRSLPVTEVDLDLARSDLRADPSRALAQTSAVAAAVRAIAPGQVLLIDNISNALTVASQDAAVARRMFVFLGTPGLLLAVFLTLFTGGILAATHRREHALLRLRGAHRGHLVRLLVAKAAILAVVGAGLGAAGGLLAVAGTLGRGALSEARRGDLAVSALAAVVLGVVLTGLALALPGIRSLARQINDERAELDLSPAPAWRRRHVDLALVGLAVLAEGVAYALGGFDVPASSVSAGQGVSLPSRWLLAPLLAWLGGLLLAVRVLQAAAARLPIRPPPRFGPVLRGNLTRSLRRRSWTVARGSLGVGLVLAFAVALGIFSATYDRAKTVDSRFTVGSDLRVTPSVLSTQPHPPSTAARFEVPGVTAVTPVISRLENAVFITRLNQDRRDLVAVDPASLRRTAALRDSFFSPGTATAALGDLARNPQGLLVRTETAEDFSVRVGDPVQVLLARGTKQQKIARFTIVGLFHQFPGFPDGVDLVANLSTYAAATGLDRVDFFLLRARDPGPATVARIEAALRAGPGASDPVDVASSRTALNKDQSSLTALDITGLVALNSLFTTLMGAGTVGIFVLGLMLHRRREYVTLRALGMSLRTLFALVLSEAMVVVAGGLVAGISIGLLTGYLLVHILQPLFLLTPVATFPAATISLLALVPLAAALGSALVATAALRLLRPTEILRES